MKKRLFAVLALLVVAAITGVSFATTTGTASTSVNAVGVSGAFASVTAATTDGKHAYTPVWNPSVNAAGQIPDDLNGDGDTDDTADNRPGDLYIVDTGTYTGDILVTLYLNNPADLVKGYTYLNLAIVVYEWDSTLNAGAGGWATTAVAGKSGTDYTDFVTLTNGYVSFILTQSANGGKYSIGIDAGSFYCIDNTTDYISPAFYIDVRQA